jgi:hypothetical protein
VIYLFYLFWDLGFVEGQGDFAELFRGVKSSIAEEQQCKEI